MKISILTPTYNRKHTLGVLYSSILKNLGYHIELEWIIIDDGSIDNTKELIDEFINEKKLNIKYYYQKNQGKMAALNNSINYITGDAVIECDSDDYFTDNAFEVVNKNLNLLDDEEVYGIVFPRCNQNGECAGKVINDDKFKTTMFDLYFKKDLTGDTTIVFKTAIRKEYKYKLENNEKFSTEARMYNEMDMKYKVVFVKEPIVVCEYREDGYTKNILQLFKNNPYGHYEYFKQLFEFNFKGIALKKRLYIVKHYIMFSILADKKHILRNTKGFFNKLLVFILYIPGNIKTRLRF